MKVFFLTLLLAAPLHAKTPAGSNKMLLEILIESRGEKFSTISPMSAEAKNIVCTKVKDKVDCSAEFNINGAVETFRIKRSDALFKYLRSKNAMTFEEELLGSTNYRTHRLSCNFTSTEKHYYSCSSDVTLAL